MVNFHLYKYKYICLYTFLSCGKTFKELVIVVASGEKVTAGRMEGDSIYMLLSLLHSVACSCTTYSLFFIKKKVELFLLRWKNTKDILLGIKSKLQKSMNSIWFYFYKVIVHIYVCVHIHTYTSVRICTKLLTLVPPGEYNMRTVCVYMRMNFYILCTLILSDYFNEKHTLIHNKLTHKTQTQPKDCTWLLHTYKQNFPDQLFWSAMFCFLYPTYTLHISLTSFLKLPELSVPLSLLSCIPLYQ